MPKKIPNKCINCIKLELEDAKKQSCWKNKICNQKRYYISHRDNINQKRNKKREITILNIDLSLYDNVYTSVLILYRSLKYNNLIKLQVKIYRGGNLESKTEEIMLEGLSRKDIYSILDQIVKITSQEYNLNKFTSMEVIKL